MEKNTIANIVTDRIKAIDAGEFQDFCDRLLLKMYPDDFTPVRAGGNCGDMKNDGYCYLSRKFFQAHASRGEHISKIKSKIENDLKGCLEKQRDVKEFIYITNDTQVGEVENFVDGIRQQFPNVNIETWGPPKIASLIMEFPNKDIFYIIDRSLPGVHTNVENELNDWGIIGEIFDFISQKIKTASFPGKNKPEAHASLSKLNEKIKINFEGDHQKMIKDAFTNNWEKKDIVEQFVQQQIEIDETRIFGLIDYIHHQYATILSVPNFEAPIKDFTVFEKIGRTFLPAEKQKNPDYISNAKAIVLYFFELCDIGKKITGESDRYSQRNLFDGVD